MRTGAGATHGRRTTTAQTDRPAVIRSNRRATVPHGDPSLGLLFVALGLCTDGLYAFVAGAVARCLRRDARVVGAGRWLTGGTYVGLGVAAALAGRHR